jgi:hypothetical protein
VRNADRAGLCGRIEAARTDTFLVRLEPISEGGSPMVAQTPPGSFSVDGIIPGNYRWRIDADGWLPASGPSSLWLKSLRVTDLGTVVMKPAGSAGGLLHPPGVPATISAMRGDSVVASVRCTGEGRFVLTNLPPGEYGLAIDAPGFKPEGSLPRFTVPQGELVDIPEVSLVRLGSLKGYIKPLMTDQEVWLLREGRLERVCRPEALADLDEQDGELLGRFECADVEPGLYSIAVRTRGFYPDTTLPPVKVEEGTIARCGTAILVAAPAESAGAPALEALQRAMEEYAGAQFTNAQETVQRLLAARQIPYGSLDRAYTLLGWCALARGASHVETARAAFRSALIVNPRITPEPDASPTVTTTMETVRRQLFGDAGPPADVFVP